MTRRINQAGMDLIKSFEGLRLAAYRCPAGVLTIGYGHTGPDVRSHQTITLQEAEALLRGDLDRFEDGVAKAIGDAPTTDHQFAAMVSLAFNIGFGSVKRSIPGFLTSTVLRMHRAGHHPLAAAAFLMWVKSGDRVLPGLRRRRRAERALYLR